MMERQEPYTKARVEVKHPYLALLGLFLGGFCGLFGETSLNIALPQLMDTFHIGEGVIQWLVIGYMLVVGIVLPFATLLMKWFSVRKLTLFALGAFIIGSLISGFAPDFAFILIGRMIQGIGAGLIMPLMFSVILVVFPVHKLGSAMGVASLIVMFAPVTGPTVSGLILGALSWRWIFFSFVAVSAAAAVFTAIYMVNPYERTRPKIDGLSCLTSVVGFGGVVFGFSLISEYGFSVPVLSMLIVSVAAIAIYARRQLKTDVPILDLKALKVPRYRTGAILVILNFGIILSTMFILPQYIQNGRLIPVAAAGLIMLPGGLVNVAVSFLSGRLYDRFGAKYIVKIGFFASALSIILFLFTSTGSSAIYIIFCHILLMIGVPLVMSPAQTDGLNALPQRLSRDGSTIINTMQQILGALCTAIVTLLLGFGQILYSAHGGQNAAEAFTKGSHYGFCFALALAVTGFLVSFKIHSR